VHALVSIINIYIYLRHK